MELFQRREQPQTGEKGRGGHPPHTWNAIDNQDCGNDYHRGTCWYARGLKRPDIPAGGRAYLEFDGAAHTCEVFLYMEKAARHEGGCSTFRVDITDYLKQDETLLTVSVDNSSNHVYPQSADFTFYGGLYRGVKLVVVPEAHFDLDCCGAPGIKVTPIVTDLERKTVEVTVEAWVKNAGQVIFTVDGQEQTAPVEGGRAQAVFALEHARLWDGLDDPHLYTAAARLDNGEEVSARFGCRTFEMDPQRGFLLNGRSYPLRGVSRHQDREGWAMPSP